MNDGSGTLVVLGEEEHGVWHLIGFELFNKDQKWLIGRDRLFGVDDFQRLAEYVGDLPA